MSSDWRVWGTHKTTPNVCPSVHTYVHPSTFFVQFWWNFVTKWMDVHWLYTVHTYFASTRLPSRLIFHVKVVKSAIFEMYLLLRYCSSKTHYETTVDYWSLFEASSPFSHEMHSKCGLKRQFDIREGRHRPPPGPVAFLFSVSFSDNIINFYIEWYLFKDCRLVSGVICTAVVFVHWNSSYEIKFQQ